ncbi:glycosyltransferase family 2 protein [Chloroflexota bacterium]
MRKITTAYPKIAIIVLNWNKWEHTLRCLESLYQISYPNYSIIVVDNGSTDGSLEKMEDWAKGKIPIEGKYFEYNPDGKPINHVVYDGSKIELVTSNNKEPGHSYDNKKLIIIKYKQSLGYPKANNIAIRYVFDVLNLHYVLIMHNDMVVAPNFLDELINAANKRPDAGIIASKIYSYTEPDGELWSEGGLLNYWTITFLQRGPKLTARTEGKDIIEMDWVPLACTLISRQVYQTVGMIDEAFSWGLEEIDFSIRVSRRGLKVLFVPKSHIWHDNERSLEYQKEVLPRQVYNTSRGTLILLQKHWHGLQLVSAITFYILKNIKYVFLFLLRSREWNNARLYLRGFLDHWKERRSHKQDSDNA